MRRERERGGECSNKTYGEREIRKRSSGREIRIERGENEERE